MTTLTLSGAPAFARRNAARLLLAAIVVIATAGLAYAYFSTQGSGSASAATATLDAPANVTASASGSDVTVAWTGVTGPGANAVTGYYVIRYTGATSTAACGSSPVALLPATPATCVDSAPDGTHTYRVVAVFHSWTAMSDPSDEVTISADATAPTVLSIDRAGASPTNAGSVAWTVTFSEDVTGVDLTDFLLSVTGVSGTSLTNVTGTGALRTVTASTGAGEGTLGLILADNDSIADANANPLGGSGTSGATDGSFVGQAYQIDRTAPTVTVEQADGQADPTGASTVHFTAVFSEPVTGFNGLDVAISGTAATGASAAVTGSGTTYDIEVTVSASGTVVASLAAGAADDLAGNASEASTSDDNSVVRDAVAPAVTIDQAGSQADPTNASTVHFTVVFSETVTGFDDADVELSGTAGATTAVVSGTGPAYGVAVSGMTANGTVIAAVAAGAATDSAGNASAASTSVDNIVVYDTVAPAVASITRLGLSPTNDDPLGWIVTFDEPVTGVTTGSFSLDTSNVTGTAPSVTSAIATGGSPSSTWMVSVATTGTVGANNGSIRLDLSDTAGVTDAATNALSAAATGDAYAFDTTVPTVLSVNRDVATPTNAASVAWTVTFSESVSGVDAADFAPANSGLSSPSITSVSGSGATYTVTANTGSGSGTLGLNVVDNDSVADAAGNALGAGFTGQDYTIDKTAPIVLSVNRADTSPTNAATVSWTVVFSKSVTGVGTADFALANTGLTLPSITGVSGSGTTYTVTASTGSGTGNLGLNVLDDDTIADGVGNPLAGTFIGQVYTVDRTGPTVSSINRSDASPTTAASVSWTVTFNDSVTGVGTADFALANTGMAGASITGISGSGTTYTVTASTGTGNGTLGLNFADDDSVVDSLGNPAGGTGAGNANFTGQVYSVDTSVLTITSVARSGGNKKVLFNGTGGTSGQTITVTICTANSFPCSAGNNAGTATATVAADGTWTTGQSSANLAASATYYAQAVQPTPAKTSTSFTFSTTSL